MGGVGSSRTGSGPPAPLIHPNILEEIFLNLPHNKVVRVCRLVCHQWKEVADGDFLWRERCRREGYRLRDASKTPTDWRLFYFLCKKRRNLVRNPRGEDNLKGWQFLEKGRKWKTERLTEPHPKEDVQTKFMTSYGMCRKAQLIDLKKEGYSPPFMDEFQPHIRVTDWYAALWICGSEYTILLQLLNQKKEVVAEYSPEPIYSLPFENNDQWNQLIHVFRDYGPGVRYVNFIHGGRVRHFWAAGCGIRITDSCVEVCPAVET